MFFVQNGNDGLTFSLGRSYILTHIIVSRKVVIFYLYSRTVQFYLTNKIYVYCI